MWFIDTGYLIALFSTHDHFHTRALQLRDAAQAQQQTLVTTDAVLFEVGAAFSKVAHRALGAGQVVEITSSKRGRSSIDRLVPEGGRG
jgi:predicted nucleic acid-binding protein